MSRPLFLAALFWFAPFGAQSALAQPLRVLKMVGMDPIPASATSFDCRRAANAVERLICGDSILATIDGSLGDTYWRLQRRMNSSERSRLRQQQRMWLRQRDSCRDRSCVVAAYEARGSDLRRDLSARQRRLRASVSRVGQCQVTRIEEIGPRLQRVQGERPDGTSIEFANGVWQVSYDPVPAIWMSRVGDPARICLISIPSGCPPGDERGRVYHATNLRTRTSWRLPDSSHSCGGA